MKGTNIKSLFSDWQFNFSPYVDFVQQIGDVAAIRRTKTGETFRRNYERALLLLAVADRYKSRKALEFGTGRGFVSGCLSVLSGIEEIHTIDKLDYGSTVAYLTSVSEMINLDKIKFIHKDSFGLCSKDLGEGFDLVFIDGEHSHKAVKNDLRLAMECSTEDAVIVFDDYRNKHKGVKKFIRSIPGDKLVVSTDGWIYKNTMITKHGDADRLVNGKEAGSGQVIYWKSGKK